MSNDCPTGNVSIPKIDNRRLRFLSYEEAESLLNALMERDKLARPSLLSLHMGLRVGEMATFRWSHIDIKRGAIRIMDPKSGRG